MRIECPECNTNIHIDDGLYEWCEAFIVIYPEEIFKVSPSDIVLIREAAQRILRKKHTEEPTPKG